MRTTTALLVLLALALPAVAMPHPCEVEVEQMKKDLDGIRGAVATFERLRPSDNQRQMLAIAKDKYDLELLRTTKAQARCEQLVRAEGPGTAPSPASEAAASTEPRTAAPATSSAAAAPRGPTPASPAPAGVVPVAPDDGKAVGEIRAAYKRAYNASDVAGVVALYAPDATLTTADAVFKGPASIAVWVKSGIDQGSLLEVLEADETYVSGDLAYEAGHTTRLTSGELHLGRYLIVMRRSAGGWRIVQHASLNAR